MQYLIGADEAGYGPNFGPLVVSASLWQAPDGTRPEDLRRCLEGPIVDTPSRADEDPQARVAVADSKLLYRPGKGLRHLERGLWAVWGVLDRRPASWTEAWDTLAPGSAGSRQAIPWYADYELPLPADADPAELIPLEAVLRRRMADAGVRLLELRSRPVFAERFNGLLRRLGSKGTALSKVTLGLVARLMQSLPKHTEQCSISVICDKHGGRNRYGGLLGAEFPDWLVEVYGESRRESVYQFGPPQQRVEFRFQSKGESHLPAALASMASKYLRELAMMAFNGFWCGRVSGLRPTAGYPQDAKRFKAAIADAQRELGIEDRLLWRSR